MTSVAETEPAGAGTFWSEPEPVWRFGSGSTLDKTEEILNDILSFVLLTMIKCLFKIKYLNEINFSSKQLGTLLKNF